MALVIDEQRLATLSQHIHNGKSVYRIFPRRFRDDPMGTGLSTSRFSDNTSATYNILYVADSFQTAFLEVLVRDQYVGKKKRRISMETLNYFVCVRFRLTEALTLLDLRDDHCVRLGVSTATTRDRNHQSGQALGRFLCAHNARNRGQIQGIMYTSRLGASDNTALFSTGALDVTVGPSPITNREWPLPEALLRYDIRVRS